MMTIPKARTNYGIYKISFQGAKVCNDISDVIIQHIDTLPKYGQKPLDVRRST